MAQSTRNRVGSIYSKLGTFAAVFVLALGIHMDTSAIVSHSLPDPRWQSAAPAKAPMSSNIVMYATADGAYHYPSHPTPYLFLCNFSSVGHYRLNRQRVQTAHRLFYFLNKGDELEICFPRKQITETLLVLFDEELVREAAYASSHTCAHLLEYPYEEASFNFEVPSIPFLSDSVLAATLDRFRYGRRQRSFDAPSRSFDAPSFVRELLGSLLRTCRASTSDMDRIKSKKSATRAELFKRLTIARSFMEDNALCPVTIDQIAKEACLNRFYFIELFRTVYGDTPHQYLRRIQLENAYSLLKTGHYSVGSVCHMVGFQSMGSFSNLFKRHYGCLPSALGKRL
jgi:AraC family transcriptional regulator